MLADDKISLCWHQRFLSRKSFQKRTEESLRSYLHLLRTDKAAYRLRHKAMTNLDSCHEGNFISFSNFYKIFQQSEGMFAK